MDTPEGSGLGSPRKRDFLPGLQVFRAVAALAVVVHHAASGVDSLVAPLPPTVLHVLDYGFLGVDLFFVLSGFIIAHAHFDHSPGVRSAKDFLRGRVVRIYPAYLPVSLAMLAALMLVPSLSGGARDISLLSSVLLLPAHGHPALFVAWTLIHEMVFYAVFLSFFLSHRALVVALAIWGASILIADHFALVGGAGRYVFGLLNLEFMLGVATAFTTRRLATARARWPVALVGLVVMAATVRHISPSNEQEWTRVGFAGGVALVLGWLVLTERSRSIAWPAALVGLGGASYSIYLVHGPFISVLSRVVARLSQSWPLALVVEVLLSTLVGVVYYRLVEKPSLALFRKKAVRAPS